MIWISIYLAVGLVWISILHHAVWVAPDEDELDFSATIFNLLLWPFILVFLWNEFRKRN